MNGIVLINKPSGVSSFSVTAGVRRRLGEKKAGHAGTLDPLASGVLPVMLGSATRVIDLIPNEKKRYRAAFALGMTTDTLDCEGEVLTEQPVCVSYDELFCAVKSFEGEIMQIPPMFSALKKDGKKLYELARSGVEVERNARKITVFSIDLLEFCDDVAVIDVVCSKGTYIRTLIDDIGLKLKCGAFMTGLERLSSGGFDIEACIDFNEFISSQNAEGFVLPVDAALKQLPEIYVTQPQSVRFLNGGYLDKQRLKLNGNGELFRVYFESRFLGTAKLCEDKLQPVFVLH